MTERGAGQVQRSARRFQIGPSSVTWDGQALCFEIDEWAVPLPRPVRGRVRVVPQALCRFACALDANGQHRWGPIAPVSRVEVEFDSPGVRWQGHAYVDSNEGDEPVDRAFREWDWSRTVLADGSTAVVYDVRLCNGGERTIAERFATDGSSSAFTPPPRQGLGRSAWGLPRTMRSEPGFAPRVSKTLEDTPFYVRSLIESRLLGETVTSVHETLDLPRVVSLPVRLMLPFKMPRLG